MSVAMGLSRTVRHRRRLVKRLLVAELLSRRGEGPLALRVSASHLRPRGRRRAVADAEQDASTGEEG